MSTVYNSNNFNLTGWDLDLPINSSGGATGAAETISSLTNYTSQYFYGNADGSMTFYAPVAGATTVSSFGAGSGLNEQGSAGWTLGTGGAMSATLEVNSVPALTTGAEGSVIIGQVLVQNSNEALAQLYYDNGKIYFKNTLWNGQHDTYQLTDASGNTPSIGLNQKFSYAIEAQGNTLTLKVIINGDTYTSTTSIDSSWDSLPLYFKAGVYDGDASASGASLPQATGAGQATFYGLDMSHAAGDGLGGLQAPTAQTDSFTGAENHVITGNMLTGDTAAAGLTLSAAAITQTTAHGGTVVENASGTFIYTPATGYTGADSFAYTVKDGSGLTANGMVDITVGSSSTSTPPPPTTDAPPVAVTETFTGAQSQPITGNVLTNDTDPNGLSLSVTAATQTTAHGSVVESANGAFTYTPTSGYVGTDSFTYTVKDSAGLTTTGTEDVSVTPGAGYKLVFDPSFSTLNLESSSNPTGTWDTTYPYATPGSANFSGRTLSSNNEAEFYSDSTVGVNPFSVNNGVLTITAAPATSAELATEAAANNGATLPYTSGLLTTDTSFAQTYGLYEVTAKLPAGQGLWPAIWMLPASGAWPPEIDIMEAVNNPTTDYMTLHTGTNNTALGSTTQVPTAATAFNTYAVDWEPNTITFYVDGKQVFQEATPSDMHQPMYMLLNLAVGGTGSWPGATNSSTTFPAQMQVSSVDVYASPNTIADINTVGVQTAPPTTTTPPPPTYLPPVAEPDVFTGHENAPITGNLLANNGNGADTDPNGLALSVTAATITTAHGATVVENADGTFTYTPTTGFTGADSFTYTLKDSDGLTTTGDASVTISAATGSSPIVTGTANNQTLNANQTIGTVINGFGNDLLEGHNGNDTLNGGTGNEKLYGYWGNDLITGGTGNDTLNGGPGNDTLVAGHGSDTLTGGGGADVFVFKAAALHTGTDQITDFSTSAGNKIDISDILSGHYNTTTSVLTNFVNIVNSGHNSIVEVDVTGHAGASGWTQVATLLNVTSLNEQTLLHNGNLIL